LFGNIVIIRINQERLIMICPTELGLRHYTDQHVGSRPRCKMHNVKVNNWSVQNLFFRLNGETFFQGQGTSHYKDLQLGVLEWNAYHNVLLNTKSQIDCNLLRLLHELYRTEEDNDMSWECCKLVDHCKEKGDVNSPNHKFLVEWNDINKTKSWVNQFH
jgi:uncharacterized paraquat-inducible protein A